MNLKLINEYIQLSGYKLKHIAAQLGITYVGLHNKLTGKRSFTVEELQKLRSILNLTDEQWMEITNKRS